MRNRWSVGLGLSGAWRRRHPCGRAALAALATTMAALATVASPAVGADSCPNAEFRTGPSKALPECRAYEMSSDPGKAGSDISLLANVQAAPGGGAVAYMSTGGFAGSQARMGRNPYVARRSGAGWANRSIAVPFTNPGITSVRSGGDLSRDLTQALTPSTKALAPGATEGAGNLFIQNTITGDLRLAAAEVTPFIGTPSNEPPSLSGEMVDTYSNYMGSSEDFGHVLYRSRARLTEDAPVLGVSTIYDLTANGARNIAIDPEGAPFSDGSYLGGAGSTPRPDRNAISKDGRRIFFGASSSQQLYMREDGVRTELISASQRTGHVGEPSSTPVYFLGASGDGSVVYFTTGSALTDDAAAPDDPSFGGYIYRYSVERGELEEIYADPVAIADQGAFGVDDAGNDLYFMPQMSGAPYSLHHWSEDGGDRVVAVFEEGFGGSPPALSTVPFSMSPDGTKLAFWSSEPLTEAGISGPSCAQGGASTGACKTVYLYDAEGAGGGGSLACVSCGDPDRGRPPAFAKLGGTVNSPAGAFGTHARDMSGVMARAVDDSGRVFFESQGRLLAGDTDAKFDVYSWRGGALELLTPGTATDSFFSDASADRKDIYVVTRDRLVGADMDDNVDVYDVRVDGGLVSQRAGEGSSVCEGDGCQGDPSAAPLVTPPGTTSFLGLPGVTAPSPKGDAGPITVSKVKTVRGTETTVKVKVPGKGNLRTSGLGLRRSSVTATKAGTYRVSVRLSQRARRALRRKHQVTVRVTVRFVPAKGEVQRVRMTVTFKTKAKEHRRSLSRSQRRAHVLSSDVRKGR